MSSHDDPLDQFATIAQDILFALRHCGEWTLRQEWGYPLTNKLILHPCLGDLLFATYDNPMGMRVPLGMLFSGVPQVGADVELLLPSARGRPPTRLPVHYDPYRGYYEANASFNAVQYVAAVLQSHRLIMLRTMERGVE